MSGSVIATAVLGLLSSAAALSQSTSAVEFPHPGVPTHSWTLSSRAEPDPRTRIRLTVAVAQDAVGKSMLRRELEQRSDPESALFAQWLTKRQVDDLVRPAPEAVHAVTQWLEAAGATDLDRTTAGDFIT